LPWWLRGLLAGAGIFYALSLGTADELYRRGWKAPIYEDAMWYLAMAGVIMPFEHRFREGPMVRAWQQQARMNNGR
jgi:hypothetical protein